MKIRCLLLGHSPRLTINLRFDPLATGRGVYQMSNTHRECRRCGKPTFSLDTDEAEATEWLDRVFAAVEQGRSAR